MWKYYKKTLATSGIRGLVRLYGTKIERYDGKETWNANWDGSGQAYMDITGMGDWYLYSEVDVEEVSEIERMLDDLYKEHGMFGYQKADDAK